MALGSVPLQSLAVVRSTLDDRKETAIAAAIPATAAAGLH
jgi:hypothetical protein